MRKLLKPITIAVIGSGSTYSPEIIQGLIAKKEELRIGRIALMDIDERKNEIVSGLSKRMLEAAGLFPEVVVTNDLDEALIGASYVFTQIRVGMLPARVKDEKIPLQYDLIGQETTGIGGFMKALRTVPVIMDIVERMKLLAPDAWLINFTNPAGIITEVLLNYTQAKTIGLCNVPINMLAAAEEMVAPNGDFSYDFLGLNHFCWLVDAAENHESKMNMLLENGSASAMAISKMEMDDALVKIAGGIPCSYLNYYYFQEKMLTKLKAAEKSRGEECMEIEEELLALYQDETLDSMPEALSKRGGARYSEAAISLLDAIENNRGEYHVANVKNNGALPFMAEDDIIEIKCHVSKQGAVPVPMPSFDNPHIIGMMRAVKTYEKLAAEAAVTGNYDTAIKALLAHPLVGDYDKLKPAFDALLLAHEAYLPQFKAHFETVAR